MFISLLPSVDVPLLNTGPIPRICLWGAGRAGKVYETLPAIPTPLRGFFDKRTWS